MIQELKISNFLSFKNEAVFSFVASNDSFAEDSQVIRINDNLRLLRFAMVYGYNASGKTNLIKAIHFLRNFLIQDTEDKSRTSGTDVKPFLLDDETPGRPSCFELTFWVEDVKYKYSLKIDKNAVLDESLYYYPGIQPKQVFSRQLNDGASVIEIQPDFKLTQLEKDGLKLKCLKNVSFFSAWNQVNVSVDIVDNVIDYFNNKFIDHLGPNFSRSNLNHALSNYEKNGDFRNYVNTFVNKADFNIADISFASFKISEDEINNMIQELPESFRAMAFKELPREGKETLFRHVVKSDGVVKEFSLPVETQSLGTKKMLGVESYVFNLLNSHGIMTIDEFENSLHPKLQEIILFEYLKNNSKSQLLITTHNDGLLDLVDDLFRKDSVFFTEKLDDGSTDLFRLTDFKGLNRLSSVRAAYRNKRFGATLMK
ncbi:MAG: ATP-binding protein [Bacteroidales bacterium]|nr:ATP-binding protein [Bacteroidales bacterium]